MFSNKEDRTTALILITVVIVCVISLIAVSTVLWQIIKGPIRKITSDFSREVKLQTLDYNFEVKALNEYEQKDEEEEGEDKGEGEGKEQGEDEREGEEQEENKQAQPEIKYDYNFAIPAKATFAISQNEIAKLQSFPDAIIDDALVADYTNWETTPQKNIHIKIPKIGIDSPVLQGQDAANLLDRGFLIYPGSFTLGEGEVVMLCHRRHFGPYDPRTCWFLDRVGVNDEIFMEFEAKVMRYSVVGVNVFEENNPLIYTISAEDDYIKIVTCTPLYSNTHRLVVLAKRTG